MAPVAGPALDALQGGTGAEAFPLGVGVHGAPEMNSAGPPPETTGGFGEDTCQFCHMDYQLNEEGGEFELLGLPDEGYEAGERYELTLRLAHPELGRAGFQLAVRFASGSHEGEQAGELVAGAGQQLQSPSYTTISYLNHSREGIQPTTVGERRWSFEWIAPETAEASVVFHAAGNAANGDGAEWGDRPYALELRLEPAAGSGDDHSVSYHLRKSSAAASL